MINGKPIVGKKLLDKTHDLSFFICAKKCSFFLNDTNTGAIGRVKAWAAETNPSSSWVDRHNTTREIIFVIEKIDKTKEYQIESFFDSMYNPPQNAIFKVSSLPVVSHTDIRKRASGIVRLNPTTRYNSRYSFGHWSRESSLDHINDPTRNFYYIPMSGYSCITTKLSTEPATFRETIHRLRLSKLLDKCIDVYGVRKSDMEQVTTLNNWINVEDYIHSLIQNNKSNILRSCLYDVTGHQYTINQIKQYWNNSVLMSMLSNDSPLKTVLAGMPDQSKVNRDRPCIDEYIASNILRIFDPEFSIEIDNHKKAMTDDINVVYNRYPLLSIINEYRVTGSEKVIADYINSIDEKDQERKTLCTHI